MTVKQRRPLTKLQIDAMTANVEFRSSLPLRDDLRKYRPEFVFLQQLKHHNSYRSIPGYNLEGFRFNQEVRWVGILVREDLKVLRRKAITDLEEEWIGPKLGKHHDPRVPILLEFEDYFIVDIHAPTHNSQKAQREFNDRIAKIFERRNKPGMAGGDWNRTRSELRHFARRIDGNITTLGKVDHIITRGFKRLDQTDLRQPHYAHGWGMGTYKLL